MTEAQDAHTKCLSKLLKCQSDLEKETNLHNESRKKFENERKDYKKQLTQLSKIKKSLSDAEKALS